MGCTDRWTYESFCEGGGGGAPFFQCTPQQSLWPPPKKPYFHNSIVTILKNLMSFILRLCLVQNIYLLIIYQRSKGHKFLPQTQNYPYLCATRCCRSLIFLTLNSVRLTPSGFKQKGGLENLSLMQKLSFFLTKSFPLSKIIFSLEIRYVCAFFFFC